MAAIDSIAAEPPWSTTVPGFPNIDVRASSDDDQAPSSVRLTYYGWPDELARAQILPRQAFIIGSRRKLSARIDQDGTHWEFMTYWRLKDSGQRSRYFRISCRKPLPLARRLPGANEALEVETRYRRWQEQRDRDPRREARIREILGWSEAAGIRPSEPALKALGRLKRPALRLVIDNTRETPS